MLLASGKEETHSFLGYQFKYILKNRSYDTNHLIIVFSGFGTGSDFTYDFFGSLNNSCRAAVLWIKDDFYQNNLATYYMDVLGEDRLEQAVIGFIREVQLFLEIDQQYCTLLGCSKGGASALYYGAKYNFKNIVASAPTIKIGSFISGIEPKDQPRLCANFICHGEVNSEKINQLDLRVIKEIDQDQAFDKNIFLISSQKDYIHNSQIKPFIGAFAKYNNFNYIESQSCLVRTHPDVTFFNTPLILSILNCLVFNLVPSFLNHVSIGDLPHKKAKVTKEPVFKAMKVDFDDESRFHPEGVFFLRGLACQNYEDLDYVLLLDSDTSQFKLDLAKGHKIFITKEYYADAFVNYDKAFFCTLGFRGLALDHLPQGFYRLSIEIIMETGERVISPFFYELDEKNISLNGKYELSTEDDILYLKIK